MNATQIKQAKTQRELGELVENYLNTIGENVSSETYAESAERLRERKTDAAELLDAAETRWFELAE